MKSDCRNGDRAGRAQEEPDQNVERLPQCIGVQMDLPIPLRLNIVSEIAESRNRLDLETAG